jgi:Phage gp6-like head-tail connector protein
MHSILDILGPTDSSVDLISLDDLKLALGITDNSEDAQLQVQITFLSRIIAEYCDRQLTFAEALETFTLDRGEDMLSRQAVTLSLYPVAEVFEVSSLGATWGDYDFDPASGRLWTGGTWGDTIAVTYSGGYFLDGAPSRLYEMPARLQKAIIETVNEGRTIGSRDPGIREVQHGDTRIAYFTPTLSTASSGYLSAVVTDLINPYRRLHVA